MSFENTLDENLIAIVGVVEMPQETIKADLFAPTDSGDCCITY